MSQFGFTADALHFLKDASERFGEDGKYLLTVGRQYSLLCEGEEAKKNVKRTVLTRLSFSMILHLIRCGRVFDNL